jgi:hypothetical protein
MFRLILDHLIKNNSIQICPCSFSINNLYQSTRWTFELMILQTGLWLLLWPSYTTFLKATVVYFLQDLTVTIKSEKGSGDFICGRGVMQTGNSVNAPTCNWCLSTWPCKDLSPGQQGYSCVHWPMKFYPKPSDQLTQQRNIHQVSETSLVFLLHCQFLDFARVDSMLVIAREMSWQLQSNISLSDDAPNVPYFITLLYLMPDDFTC